MSSLAYVHFNCGPNLHEKSVAQDDKDFISCCTGETTRKLGRFNYFLYFFQLKTVFTKMATTSLKFVLFGVDNLHNVQILKAYHVVAPCYKVYKMFDA